MEALKPLLGDLFENLSVPIVQIYKNSNSDITKIQTSFHDAIQSGDEGKLNELKDIVQAIKQDKFQKINEALKDAMEPLIGDLRIKVTENDLGKLFDPISSLVRLIEAGFNLVLNPEHQIYCLKTLCQHRKTIENLDISKEGALDELNRLLDSEESDVLYRRWWTWYYYNCEAWSLYYYVWQFNGIGSTIYPIRKAGLKYAKMQRDYDKKFSFKFGDYLYHMAKESTPQTWKSTVEECFMIGFQKANKMAIKRAKKIAKTLFFEFIHESIAGKIEGMIIQGMKEVITPLAKLIIKPLDQLLDINAIVEESVQMSLRGAVEELTFDSMIGPFVKQISE